MVDSECKRVREHILRVLYDWSEQVQQQHAKATAALQEELQQTQAVMHARGDRVEVLMSEDVLRGSKYGATVLEVRQLSALVQYEELLEEGADEEEPALLTTTTSQKLQWGLAVALWADRVMHSHGLAHCD